MLVIIHALLILLVFSFVFMEPFYLEGHSYNAWKELGLSLIKYIPDIYHFWDIKSICIPSYHNVAYIEITSTVIDQLVERFFVNLVQWNGYILIQSSKLEIQIDKMGFWAFLVWLARSMNFKIIGSLQMELSSDRRKLERRCKKADRESVLAGGKGRMDRRIYLPLPISSGVVLHVSVCLHEMALWYLGEFLLNTMNVDITSIRIIPWKQEPVGTIILSTFLWNFSL